MIQRKRKREVQWILTFAHLLEVFVAEPVVMVLLGEVFLEAAPAVGVFGVGDFEEFAEGLEMSAVGAGGVVVFAA